MTGLHPSRRAWPRVVAFLCVLTLALGMDYPHYKGLFWTRALWTQSLHAAPEALPAKVFARGWAEGFNLASAKQHSAVRVWAIVCVREGEAVFYCEGVFVNTAKRSPVPSCVYMALGSSGQMFQAEHVRCSGKALAAAGFGAVGPKA